ncbi:MAG: Cell division protein FtsX [Parcubacteria group bacterium GW2011_GWC1_38_22]|nr:MAG: Cell division protein FtsX [Parcubacteria group bacterium GW2011_GWC1_38_22]
MKFTKLKRTFKEGLDNFIRNGWLSFATVSVLAISLYVISVTLILGVTANIVLQNIQDKINVSVYFNPDVEESRILEIKESLVGFQEIKTIDYVSKEKALSQFKKLGEKNPSINQALDEIGENPLLSALVIRAKNPTEYDIIVKAIKGSSFSGSIGRIDFEENQVAIERLTGIMKIVEQVGLTLGIVFVFIGILITFNAIRLTMYAHKQEFEIMRLVGASNIYIRMPFVFEGIFYGVVSAFVVMLALFITSKFLAPITEGSIAGGDIVSFYLSNFFIIFGSLLLSGIFLGTISGVIAIRRYLKV